MYHFDPSHAGWEVVFINLGKLSAPFGPDAQSRCLICTDISATALYSLIYVVVKNLLTWSVIKAKYANVRMPSRFYSKLLVSVHRLHKAQATVMSKRQNT